MSFEHVGEAEALAAYLAGIGLLACVGAAVAFHVGPAGEALPADFANKRLLSCTHSFMKEEKEKDRCISQIICFPEIFKQLKLFTQSSFFNFSSENANKLPS